MRAVKRIAVGLLLLVVVAAGVAWTQRQPLQVWWAIRGLTRADDDSRPAWLDRVAALGEAAIDPLLARVVDGDERTADAALAAVDHLARQQGVGSGATAELLRRFSKDLPQMPPAGQARVLRVVVGWMGDPSVTDETIPLVARLLEDTAAVAEPDAQAAGLELAAAVLRLPQGKAVVPAARAMAAGGLRSTDATVRLCAVQLCLQPEVDGLDQVVGLLRDPSAEVRRAAVLAVGPAEGVVREETLLAGLHDTDAEVRRLTEAALRGRGLRPEQLELGRLLTHPQPTTRLRVLDHLNEVLDQQRGGSDVEIDPGVWLRRLSHDGSPAVRAAALRLMSEQALIDLTDRIDQMARTDPNPTVSQLAQFYLRRKPPARHDGDN